MADNDVSTGNPYKDRRRTFKFVCTGLMVGAGLIVVAFIALRLRQTYVMEKDIALLHAEHAILTAKVDQVTTDTSFRLDGLERALFGDVLAKLEAQEAKSKQDTQISTARTRLEQWMINRDNDMRKRIEALERFRLELQKDK